ncbi:energy-coupling factor transporter transmembrane protein EcfT [Staphylococcus sp. SQ8-PEA]|uniref:Energy-coupling factor transporter transmembrane protein EcfT n=1 Tax=Staphylococcus marylandisciuri TaxID=2981529 RepID=A0ABT2QMD8_9STAP|nr:energy-coupling factor transporter transmembrane component T [Staphylococcus marylandisciuri]MCU5745130.1 energy-coupling factor transporter transmembrane protein EcfT [Staphylococcus marylandisciuri]
MKDKFILGRYLPIDSFFHSLDPRAKFIFVFFFIILIFFAHSVGTYLWIFSLILLAIRLARIHIIYIIKGLTPLWIFLILTFLMHMFLTKGGKELIHIGFLTVDTHGIEEGIYIALRLLFIMCASTILTLATSPLDLTHAFERLLAPFRYVKVPVQQLSLMMAIALRFIPTLMEEMDKIILAQKSRGSEMSSGNLWQRLKAFVPILIPIFISAFQRAEDLAIAMEVRGYEVGVERTNYRHLNWKLKDTLFLLSIIPISLVLLLLKYLGV